MSWLSEAYRAGATAYPDLILLDMWRVQDSIAFVQAYQHLALSRYSPLVLLTVAFGFSVPELHLLKQLSFTDIVEKPLTPHKAQQLSQLVAQSLRFI